MKPILFNTDMVRAILEGRKTVTRRLVKQKYRNSVFEMFGDDLCEANPYRFVRQFVPCKPPYRPGDILYVRETWCDIWGENGTWLNYGYAADGEPDTDYWGIFRNGVPIKSFKWRPSIHMPREAARIFLRVTDVRVERLQEITPEQIDAEGCKEYGYRAKTMELMPSSPCYFTITWDNTIKKADRALYGWDANPWVWVIEFERCEKPQSQLEKDILRYYSPAVLGLGETERTMKENDAGGACAAGAGGQKADRPVHGRGKDREIPQPEDKG